MKPPASGPPEGRALRCCADFGWEDRTTTVRDAPTGQRLVSRSRGNQRCRAGKARISRQSAAIIPIQPKCYRHDSRGSWCARSWKVELLVSARRKRENRADLEMLSACHPWTGTFMGRDCAPQKSQAREKTDPQCAFRPPGGDWTDGQRVSFISKQSVASAPGEPASVGCGAGGEPKLRARFASHGERRRKKNTAVNDRNF